MGTGNNKASKSNYNSRIQQISGGVKIDDKINIDGAYSDKNIKGQKYSIGKAPYFKENEVGNSYGGGVNIKKMVKN